MHCMFRIPSCVALLALCQCQTDRADELTGLTQAQAPYEPGGTVGSPPQDPCRANGICDWYQCGEDDPDCEEAPSIDTSDTADEGQFTQGTVASLTLGSWAFEGEVYLTPISGFASDDAFTLGTPTSGRRAVYSLLLRERSDEPCHAAIGIEDLEDETIDVVPVLNLCGGEPPTSSTLPGSYLDVNAGGADDHDFLSGVSVCMNRDDDKVKGLSVVGKRLTSAGDVLFLNADDDPPHRANCHTWMSFVECPHEQVATAVELHFRDGNRQSLTGVALHCRTPVWTPRPQVTL